MRSNKYRVWDTQEKRWADESLVCLFPDGEVYEVWFDDPPQKAESGQYRIGFTTGLKDKHGKEIFEGDIVIYGVRGLQNIGSNKLEHQLYGPVQWIQGSCCWWLVDKHMDAGSVYEVIGNIYENPELLPKDERI